MIQRLFAITAAIALIGAIAAAIWARFIHPFRLRVTHVLIELPRSHRHLAGTTLAFVTDIHVGPHFPASALQPTLRALRHAHPDVVLFGGDYISESPRYLPEVRDPLTDMAATARFGAWGVLGNHDIANIRDKVLRELEPTGITFLENDAVEVTTDKGSFWLAGVDEILLGNPDPEASFARVPADALTIALWHDPDHAEKLEPFGPLLMLAGHSHGGQVRLPIVGPVAAPKLGRKYASGRYHLGNMTLFVSNGIGMYRPPVRFNCPPEVVFIKLIG